MLFFRYLEMCRKCAVAVMIPLVIAGWLTGESTQALTTFGKSNTQPPREIIPTSPPGRACSRQTDCAGVRHSSCVRTHHDPTTRCLCGDNLSPVNGQCEVQAKALYHVCSSSDDCNDGLVCGSPNITDGVPPHLRVYQPKERLCICDVENNYVEREFTCSGADILNSAIFVYILALIKYFY